jgi:hypothetical protein
MTKVNKKTKPVIVQTHIAEAFKVINEHLPARYVPLVQENLKKQGVTDITSGTIRNVRNKGAEECTNLPVLNALLEVAKAHKAQVERLIENITKVNGQENGSGNN